MNQEKKSYQSIFKATSLFGGVQVLQIIISIIRSKAIAVLLGPAGMGIAGLLTSGIQMVASLSSFGLGTSAIRDVSAAHTAGDRQQISKTITVFRKWIWVTGTFGMVLVILLSPLLSYLSFEDYGYTWAFALISITLLVNQLQTGQTVLLRGLRRIKDMAKGSVLGSFLGLLITLPLYYFFGIKGIVPAIIITSLIGLTVMHYFAARIDYAKTLISWKESWAAGKGMLKMGLHLSISGIVGAIGAYAIRAFLSQTGSVAHVGFYVAGFAIINTYVGMIFNAMSMDYFPRLAGLATDMKGFKACINQQAEIALLILGPVLCVFVVFLKLGVLILYSSEFFPIVEMLQWAALGVLFKAGSWPLGFALLAKGDSLAYLSFEVIVHFLLFGLSAVLYTLVGLEGLGVGYLLLYGIYMIGLLLITYFKYNFRYTKTYVIEFLLLTLLVSACVASSRSFTGWLHYAVGGGLCLLTSAYSLYFLQKRIDVWEMIRKWKDRQ